MTTPIALDALYATGAWLLEERRARDAMDIFRAMLISAPTDERGWLGLGAAHEAVGELAIAARLYGLCARSGRCAIARARVLRALERNADANDALAEAELLLEQTEDDDLRTLLAYERSLS